MKFLSTVFVLLRDCVATFLHPRSRVFAVYGCVAVFVSFSAKGYELPLGSLQEPILVEQSYLTNTFDRLQQLAKAGDPKAQNAIGFLRFWNVDHAQQLPVRDRPTAKERFAYFSSRQSDKNEIYKGHREAFSLFKMAAEAGLPDAQFNLAWMYASGYILDVSPDRQNAIFWFEKCVLNIEKSVPYNSPLFIQNRRTRATAGFYLAELLSNKIWPQDHWVIPNPNSPEAIAENRKAYHNYMASSQFNCEMAHVLAAQKTTTFSTNHIFQRIEQRALDGNCYCMLFLCKSLKCRTEHPELISRFSKSGFDGLLSAAENGNLYAMLEAYKYYSSSYREEAYTDIVPKDDTKAMLWLEHASKLGSSFAYNSVTYRFGRIPMRLDGGVNSPSAFDSTAPSALPPNSESTSSTQDSPRMKALKYQNQIQHDFPFIRREKSQR